MPTDIAIKPTKAQAEMYKELINSLQSDVKKHQAQANKAQNGNHPMVNYTTALDNTPARQIGLIVDDKYTIGDLITASRINPPDALYWLQLRSWDAFKDFLEKRGLPSYLSLDGDLGGKQSGLDCAKLLKEYCSKHMLDLPKWECHSPTISSKQAIEFSLYDYSKPKGKK